MTDSASTLTGSHSSLDTLDPRTRLPLYASESQVPQYHDSTSTLNSATGELSYPRNPLHQSDTRLLHASQIELKSTNYFSRPALSCSSLDETDTEDNIHRGSIILEPPPEYTELDFDSQRALAMRQSSSQPFPSGASRRKAESMHSSIDGSYFSIGESEEDDIYENVASIRLRSGTRQDDSENTLSRRGTVYQNYPSQPSTNPDFDVPTMSSNISLVNCNVAEINPPTSMFYQPTKPARGKITLNNNQHHISTGSSAYGSGSMGESQQSGIDTYL